MLETWSIWLPFCVVVSLMLLVVVVGIVQLVVVVVVAVVDLCMLGVCMSVHMLHSDWWHVVWHGIVCCALCLFRVRVCVWLDAYLAFVKSRTDVWM